MKRFVPTVLKIDAVLRWILPFFSQPWHKSLCRHVFSIKFGLQSFASPTLSGNADGVLCRRDSHLFEASLMLGAQLFGLESCHILVVQFVAETPFVLASHIRCTSPTLVAPPHIAKGEERFYLVAVVRLALLPAIRSGINRGSGIVK